MSLPSDPLEPRALARLQRALTELPREQVPSALQRRLRLEACLADVEPLPVPLELDELVALEISTRNAVSGPLRSLETQSAPSVLDRLVAEELMAPQRSVAERFVGDLPRVELPTAEEAGRVVPGPWARAGWLRAAAGLAAAVLGVLTIGPLFKGTVEQRPTLRFARVSAKMSELDPVAQALVEGLSGGASLEQRKREEAR